MVTTTPREPGVDGVPPDRTVQPVPSPPLPDANASEKTLLVIEAALTHSRFTSVVEATGLAKATVHRIVSTLVDSGFVTVAMDGTYLPGPKFLYLGRPRPAAHRHLRHRATVR